MKRLLIAIILFPVFVKAQTELKSVNDSLFWIVIKNIIIKDSVPVIAKENVYYEILQNQTVPLKEKTSKEIKQHFYFTQGRCNQKITLTKKDLASIDKQLSEHKVYKLDTVEIKLLLRTQEHIKRYNQNYYRISTPIFFNNFNFAYVRVEFICPLCGQGTGYIMQKTNRGWTINCILDEWIN